MSKQFKLNRRQHLHWCHSVVRATGSPVEVGNTQVWKVGTNWGVVTKWPHTHEARDCLHYHVHASGIRLILHYCVVMHLLYSCL